MANYTLRIWDLAGDSFTDTDFDTLEELYPTILGSWSPKNASVNVSDALPGVNLSGSFAVYDNVLGKCINSDRGTQVGLAKDQPRQDFLS
jgi:hypothetical protein